MKKKLFLTLLFFCYSLLIFSQTQGISYQAVILNPDADSKESVLNESEITIRFTIIDNQNLEEYQEYHETATDAYGMINLYIGQGITTSSANFKDISWNGLTKKLKVEIDFSGSNSNFKSLALQELMFMPQSATEDYSQIIYDNANAIDNEIERATIAETTIEADLQTEIDARLTEADFKEDILNKSTDMVLDGSSDTKYPSVKSVKNYVDENSTLTLAGLNLKVDKVTGKGLSTEDYSTAEKTKLAAISGSNTGDQDLSSYA
ncbi:MAG: hypothetical protein V7767_05625, partial [Leeuwenhoekiella sp.]